jgi:hypothetical protein
MNSDPTSLDRLHDVLAPPPVPWWPPAPGWDWLLGTLAVLLCLGACRLLVHWQRNRYRREALAEWHRQAGRLHDPNQRTSALTHLAELLKRTAITAFSRERVAALTGPAWFAFLDQTGTTNGFTSGSGEILENAAYDGRSSSISDDTQLKQAAALVHDWIKHHHPGGAA